MPRFFVKQPNGLLAEFSTVVDNFIGSDMTEEDALHRCSGRMGEDEAAAKVRRGQHDLDLEGTGPHELTHLGPGLGRFHECLVTILTGHGWGALLETLAEMKASEPIPNEILTEAVLADMANLEDQRYIDDSDWTTERGLALLDEVRRLRTDMAKAHDTIRQLTAQLDGQDKAPPAGDMVSAPPR